MAPSASGLGAKSRAVERSIVSIEEVPYLLKDRTSSSAQPDGKVLNAYKSTVNSQVKVKKGRPPLVIGRLLKNSGYPSSTAHAKAPIVLRGGFGPLIETTGFRQLRRTHDFRAFPPLCNAAYELNTQGRMPKTIRQENKITLASTIKELVVFDHGDVVGAVPALGDADLELSLDGNCTEIGDPSENVSSPRTTSTASKTTANKTGDTTSVLGQADQSQSGDSTLLGEITVSAQTCGTTKGEVRLSKGEILARTINWARPPFWGGDSPESGGHFFPVTEMRDEFVKLINSGAEMLHCTKCGTDHIPPGPPLTIGCRDTCGSKLPEWFPREQFTKPWDSYIKLWNQIVLADEVAQGAILPGDPSKVWDLHWHDPRPDWKAIRGRREGFWKCRIDPSAPELEKNCNVCHASSATDASTADLQSHSSFATRKTRQIEWIEKHINRPGSK